MDHNPKETPRFTSSERVPAGQAAALLGVSLRTLDRYQAAGIITPLPVPLRPRYFDAGQLRQLTTPSAGIKVTR